MKLSTALHQFFDYYMPQVKGVSANTVKTYRDCFSLFLPFAAEKQSVQIDSLRLMHLSPALILNFLDHLEQKRDNITRTRNLRLATFKSLAKMIRLMYSDHLPLANKILAIPQKRAQKPLLGFLTSEEILKLLAAVDMKKQDALRDYTILHLLFDSGARASELATAHLEYFDHDNCRLAVLGKGNRFRLVPLWPITVELVKLYIEKYRAEPKLLYKNSLFINQRGQAFTRHGIYRLCKKYLCLALPAKRVQQLSPAHCFRHTCAMNLLAEGKPLSHIQNHLGHDNMQSTMVYLHMDLTRCREAQKKFIQHSQATITSDPKIDELIDWGNKDKILKWLDSL